MKYKVEREIKRGPQKGNTFSQIIEVPDQGAFYDWLYSEAVKFERKETNSIVYWNAPIDDK